MNEKLKKAVMDYVTQWKTEESRRHYRRGASLSQVMSHLRDTGWTGLGQIHDFEDVLEAMGFRILPALLKDGREYDRTSTVNPPEEAEPKKAEPESVRKLRKVISDGFVRPDVDHNVILSFYESIDDQGMFEKSFEVENWHTGGGSSYYSVVLKSEDIKIKFTFYKPTGYSGKDEGATIAWDGHVSYQKDNKWYTFDRRGIDDSFRGHNGKSDYLVTDPNLEVIKQYEKIQERMKIKLLAIPGTSINYAEESVEKLRKQLREGKRISVTPAGFGTGFTFSPTKSGLSRWSRPASAQQKVFWGVDRLYYETIDCD